MSERVPNYLQPKEWDLLQRPAFVELLHLLGRLDHNSISCCDIHRLLPKVDDSDLEQALWELSVQGYLKFWGIFEEPLGPMAGWCRHDVNSFSLADRGAKLALVAILLIDGPCDVTFDAPLFLRHPNSEYDLGRFSLEDDVERVKNSNWQPDWFRPAPDFASLWDD